MGRDREQVIAKQGRLVGLVIAVAMCLWIAAQWIGPEFGWSGRYAILIDLLALAAFFWALVVTFQIWRQRHSDKG